jgi:hypothetical protein
MALRRSKASSTGLLFAGKNHAFCPRAVNRWSACSRKAPQASFRQ